MLRLLDVLEFERQQLQPPTETLFLIPLAWFQRRLSRRLSQIPHSAESLLSYSRDPGSCISKYIFGITHRSRSGINLGITAYSFLGPKALNIFIREVLKTSQKFFGKLSTCFGLSFNASFSTCSVVMLGHFTVSIFRQNCFQTYKFQK